MPVISYHTSAYRNRNQPGTTEVRLPVIRSSIKTYTNVVVKTVGSAIRDFNTIDDFLNWVSGQNLVTNRTTILVECYKDTSNTDIINQAFSVTTSEEFQIVFQSMTIGWENDNAYKVAIDPSYYYMQDFYLTFNNFRFTSGATRSHHTSFNDCLIEFPVTAAWSVWPENLIAYNFAYNFTNCIFSSNYKIVISAPVS